MHLVSLGCRMETSENVIFYDLKNPRNYQTKIQAGATNPLKLNFMQCPALRTNNCITGDQNAPFQTRKIEIALVISC